MRHLKLSVRQYDDTGRVHLLHQKCIHDAHISDRTHRNHEMRLDDGFLVVRAVDCTCNFGDGSEREEANG